MLMPRVFHKYDFCHTVTIYITQDMDFDIAELSN